ncbi:hypothetical protein GH714_024443 [Hevea brasiliensis]|uniref:NB-ARC domain-containing protein n=1 Tax=Hevea brasiliensis TaxID=3981 RepID=A0A6A6LDI1_HEVBR|nr:hypothetical protein GH714_024443 [Hevea brasiliensis]
MNALKDADVNLIGVYGMGGVGKTTLVKQIAAQVREYGIFKLVVMATVTHSPELKKVQQEIADWLDYKFDVESVEVRAARLSDSHARVKMHDVVHSFAASIASEHHHVFTAAYQTELEEWPNKDFFEQCTSISLPYCNIPKLPEVLECPKLKSFFMFNNSSLKIPENLFSRMEELKVLDLTGMHLSPLPSSLQYLENLQTLCLDGCVWKTFLQSES